MSNLQIYVRFLHHRHLYLRSMYFFFFYKFSNRFPILISMAFLIFSNRPPMTSVMYALTLTNKSAIDLRIWKGHRFKNTLKLDCD